jgi:hypothetical protein
MTTFTAGFLLLVSAFNTNHSVLFLALLLLVLDFSFVIFFFFFREDSEVSEKGVSYVQGAFFVLHKGITDLGIELWFRGCFSHSFCSRGGCMYNT